MQRLPDFAVVPHSVGIAADIHDVPAVKHTVNENGCHSFATDVNCEPSE
jgi:hypothetical protein